MGCHRAGPPQWIHPWMGGEDRNNHRGRFVDEYSRSPPLPWVRGPGASVTGCSCTCGAQSRSPGLLLPLSLACLLAAWAIAASFLKSAGDLSLFAARSRTGPGRCLRASRASMDLAMHQDGTGLPLDLQMSCHCACGVFCSFFVSLFSPTHPPLLLHVPSLARLRPKGQPAA